MFAALSDVEGDCEEKFPRTKNVNLMNLLIGRIVMLLIRLRAEDIVQGYAQLVGFAPVCHREIHKIVCRCSIVVTMIEFM